MRVSFRSMAHSNPLLQSATDAIGEWIESATASGWLADTAPQQLSELATATPSELFDSTERPLVVGLFGGTGVGKSTLLNRMAGQEIARASAERPTSRTVTAYLHHSQHLDQLPQDFPMQRLASVLHHQERWRDVLWLDMPDVDSVAAEHRELVLQWLPYIDLLIYVVSPERYRDASAWTLLREQGNDHAWQFVFNQRDRGTAQQLVDFRTLLAGAGFVDPAVYATASPPGQEAPDDDLQALLESLDALSERKLIDELARRGVTERINKVLTLADSLASPSLANKSARRALQDQWNTHWDSEKAGITSSLGARALQLSAHSAAQAPHAPEALAEQLIDASAAARIDAAIGGFVQALDSTGDLPRRAAKASLSDWRASVAERVRADTAHALADEMAHPGSSLQRMAIRCLTVAATSLPTLALLWVAWRVFNAFRTAATDAAAYLNMNFAVTAVLLILVAWALPWWLARRLKPSNQSVLERGLSRGIERSLTRLHAQMSDLLDSLDAEREDLDSQLRQIQSTLGAAAPHRSTGPVDPSDAGAGLSEPLKRLVAAK